MTDISDLEFLRFIDYLEKKEHENDEWITIMRHDEYNLEDGSSRNGSWSTICALVPNDNPYIAYSDGTNVFLAKSTDGGKSFSNATKISNSTWNLNPYDDPPHPQVSVSGNGVFAVWKYTISPNGNHAPFFAASTDSGNTFSSQINLNVHSVDIREIPQIATSDSKVYVLWTDEDHNGIDIFLLKGNFTNTVKESDNSSFSTLTGYSLFSEYLNYFVVMGIAITAIISVIVITRVMKRK